MPKRYALYVLIVFIGHEYFFNSLFPVLINSLFPILINSLKKYWCRKSKDVVIQLEYEMQN